MALYSDKTKPNIVSAQQMEQERKKLRLVPAALTGASMLVGFIPGVGALAGGIGHAADRINNNAEAKRELKMRAKFYAPQIAQVLGMQPDKVTLKDFEKAATMSPQLRRVFNEPLNKRNDENRSSMLVNAGVSAAGAVGLGGFASMAEKGGKAIKIAHGTAQVGKQFLGAAAGGAVAGVLAKDKYSGQELVEAMEKNLAEADAKGIDRRQVVSPYLMFLLRVAQDPVLAKEIDAGVRKEFGKPLHNLTAQQMDGVMAVHKGLAEAVTREANALATGQDDIRSIAAGVPDIKGAYVAQADAMARTGNGMSHVARLNAQRAAARGANDNTVVANDHDSFVGRVNAGRTAAGKANELS